MEAVSCSPFAQTHTQSVDVPARTLPQCRACPLSTGGIGEAVCAAVMGEPGVTVTRLAVSHVPRSGKPAELLRMFGIDKDAIMQAVRAAVSKSRNAE